MAKKEDRKKQKKRLKEKSKARKRVERNKYPRIEVLDDGEDKAFMSTVKQIVAEFDFENDAHCRPQERVLYHFHRQIGLDGLEEVCELPALSEIAEAHGENIEDFRHDLFLALFTHFGKWIFDQLPEAYRRLPLPFYYYHATPLGRNLIVTFQFLPRVKGPHGIIYHSPHEPTVNTRAGDRKVGFSRHAIEQACVRLAPILPLTYEHFQAVAFYFRCCTYFDTITLPDGTEVLRLVGKCSGALADVYFRQIANLDSATIENDQCCFVLGYCPIQEVRDFVVAKTTLFPGYRGTPEAALLASATISSQQRRQLLEAAEDSTLARALDEQQIAALKWYHENGVPQVVVLDRDIYAAE